MVTNINFDDQLMATNINEDGPLMATNNINEDGPLMATNNINDDGHQLMATFMNEDGQLMVTNINGDGHKGCKCKKSMCAQLYCACFGSQFYCDESCSCQGCINRTNYEDTLDELRDQIKERDPDAFRRKINPVEQIHEGGHDQSMAIVLKHKKGCTCKKIKCHQAYCVCYKVFRKSNKNYAMLWRLTFFTSSQQAQVGCSAGCRCEGCKNTYGRKVRDYIVYNRPHIAINGTPKDSEKTNSELTRLEVSPPESHNYHQSINPPTIFQYAKNDYYAPSPESVNSYMIGTSRRELYMPLLDQQPYPNSDVIIDNQLITGQEINELLDLDPIEYIIDNNDKKELNIPPCEPSIPRDMSSVISPDDKSDSPKPTKYQNRSN
ncbi:hypothetical protein LXL04_005279 [Taraxacum kok-saghyz]